MRLLVLLCGLVVGACPWISHAAGPGQLIEPLPTGQINWTQGVVEAQGAGSVEQAIDNIIQAVVQVRLDDENNVRDRVVVAPKMWAEVKEMASASKIVDCEDSPDGETRITVQMSLFGGFAQLLLPAEIKQVEPIKPLNNSHLPLNESDVLLDVPNHTLEAGVYTGLIVDARNTGVKPAMVPILMDESGKEVYSSAFVSREYAVQQGVCKYVRQAEGIADLPRVGPKPLTVKGLRVADSGRCNIVISNADASKLHGASAHLKFLKQCRVVIVIDP